MTNSVYENKKHTKKVNASREAEQGLYLSVVAPAYNEAQNLPMLVREITKTLEGLSGRWEIIIVNDASQDNSTEVLKKLLRDWPQLRAFSLRRRSGQTAALDAGLRKARGQFISTLDADLQNDPSEIPRLLEFLEQQQVDMVNGWRINRRDSWLRRLSTRIANKVRNRLTREQIHDSACGLRVFRRDCLARIKLFDGLHRFLPTLFRMEGFRVLEVPVKHRPRVAGRAKYGIWNRLFRALRDTFAIRWMQSRSFNYENQIEQLEPSVTDIEAKEDA